MGFYVSVYAETKNNTQFIDIVKKVMPDKYRKIYRIVLKHHPNFEEEYNMIKNLKKYNI